MKKSDAQKFAARINDLVEDELVACGFNRDYVVNYLHAKKNHSFFVTTCKDLIELQNFMKRNNRMK